MNRHDNVYPGALTLRYGVLSRGISRALLGIGHLFVGLYRWYRRRKMRADAIAHVRSLDDHLLRDVALERHDIPDVISGRTVEPIYRPGMGALGHPFDGAVRAMTPASADNDNRIQRAA